MPDKMNLDYREIRYLEFKKSMSSWPCLEWRWSAKKKTKFQITFDQRSEIVI